MGRVVGKQAFTDEGVLGHASTHPGQSPSLAAQNQSSPEKDLQWRQWIVQALVA